MLQKQEEVEANVASEADEAQELAGWRHAISVVDGRSPAW